MDQRYVTDDSYIYRKLESHNISSDIINKIILIISNIRNGIRYKYLNLEYLTVACYSLVYNDMDIKLEHIINIEKIMIKSSDHDNSCETLLRYAKYVITSYQHSTF